MTPSAALAFARAHPRAIAACLAALLVAFAAGRFTRHPETKWRETVEVRTQYVDRWQERVVTREVVKERVHKETRTETQPSGATVTVAVEDSATDSASGSDAAASGETTVAQTVKAEEVKTESAAPSWRVSALGGLRFDGKRYYGGEVSRRIVGPIWLGVEARTDSAGVAIGVEW